MSEDWAIKIENLSKVYKIFDKPTDRVKEALNPFRKRYSRDFYALNDVSLTIKKGETVGIIGKNGAGKSTILKIITGVLTPTSGSVQVNGRIASLLELGAGFNPEMTGIENIYMNGTIMGYSKEEMDDRVQDIIDFADIGEFIHQPVKNYSSGMFVRLAFAVAVHVKPDILIVDEALSVGDTQFQIKSISYMKRLFLSGVTVILVSHDLASIKELCNRALYLDNGNIILDDAPKKVVNIYERYCREEMSKISGDSQRPIYELSTLEKGFDIFQCSKIFEERVNVLRQGNGKAYVRNVRVVDVNGVDISNAEFNQEIEIYIHIEVMQKVCFSVGYHICDDKNIEILGSNTLLENIGEIKCEVGDKFVVKFTTKLPLTQGQYHVFIVLSHETVKNRTAQFIDSIENAYSFVVLENDDCRIWNKVYVDNKVEILR